jgi:dihydroorotate dehydrogenase (NAD+) catalytic subunit
MDVKIEISGIKFKNPIILGSGPLSASKAGLLRADKTGFGGVVTKSVTITPSEGNPAPHWAFGSGYLVSADGLPNKGYKAMAKDIKEAKESGIAIPIIASVAGASPEEFTEMSVELAKNGADAIELNLVCPHRGTLVGRPKDEPLGRYWSQTPERSFMVIKAVKDVVKIPVWAKFPSLPVLNNFEIALKMEEAGVDALVPFPGAFVGMVIDLNSGKPVLGNLEGTGTITGHAVKPGGIKCVSELSRILRKPVIGTGGVSSSVDVIEYAMVGAQAVQVLTAIMQKTTAFDLIAGIEKFMSDKGYDSFQELIGKTLAFLPPRQ